jgi:hypothetical protein
MAKTIGLVLPLLLLFFVNGARLENEADQILRLAHAWKPGQPIPVALSFYKHDGDCFLVDSDTEAIVPELHNLPLLVALIVTPHLDQRVSDEALNAALSEYGPAKVFKLLGEQLMKVSGDLYRVSEVYK